MVVYSLILSAIFALTSEFSDVKNISNSEKSEIVKENIVKTDLLSKNIEFVSFGIEQNFYEIIKNK